MRIRRLGFLILVVSFLGFACFVVSQSGPDVSSMEALKSSLKTESKLNWSNPDPCKWNGVRCDKNNRVTVIQIRNLQIQGSIPPDVKNLSSLIILELMGNELTGPFPDLSGLGSLQRLLINNNLFSSIPSSLFTGMSSLQTVSLDNNTFSSWEIPNSLKDATSLSTFSAVSCNISGRIPDFFGSQTFPSLTQLHLSMNYLQGGLPASFSGSMIQSLWLNGQQGQKLNGSISVLQNMTSLSEVWLNGNQFSGPIPDLSGLTSLKKFSVRDNQLTGIVPLSLVTLSSLSVVNLTNNLLQGPKPKFGTNIIVDLDPNSNSFCLDVPGKPCDSRVNDLLSIAEPLSYPIRFAQSWKGNDPCNKGWLGISCPAGDIVVINFKNMGLTGTISPSFANLSSLQTINLAQNNLTGTIPTQLTTLPKLVTLDVSDNQLYGQAPKFTHNVDLNTKGNVNFGKDHPPDDKNKDSSGNGKKKTSSKIVGGVVGAVCLLGLVGTGVWLYITKRKRPARVQSPYTMMTTPGHAGAHGGVKINVAPSGNENESGHSHGSNGSSNVHLVEAGNMVISIQVLRSVTNNFSEEKILGRGGFGTVYKGELHDGTTIAVKRMEASVVSDKGLAEFKSEISVLTKVRHRHLVALLGHCLDGNERLLVYEFMPQGTLSRHLFHWKEEGLKPMEWTRRLSIALDVARGVEYLHTLAHQSFIHRDLKPSNILLGDDMRAKVSDFGLVRLAPDGKQSIETRIAGTFGYLAPEYAVTGRVTTKVDVYSFGVILMEIISGRKALDETQPEDCMHLVTWFRRMLINKDSFKNVVDPTIELDEETLASIGKVSELAGHCCAREPYQRPDMGHVVNVASSLVEQWKPVEANPDDIYGIDYNMSLPQVMEKWQAFEGTSRIEDSSSSATFYGSRDNTQTSLPNLLSNSFTSGGR